MFDLHRHDNFSIFDGFGHPKELAQYAKSIGYKALGITNHGNTNGLVQHYYACKEAEIKPVLGVEGYFLPKWKEKTRGYHLILIAKNTVGYKNMNIIQFEGEKQKYYNPIWDFKMLEKYHEGLICTSACVAGYLAQCIIKNDFVKAEKYLKKMQSIFGEDFYVEIQPYKISEEGVQEKVNVESIKLANKLGIKCILTSDSHRGAKEDFDSYLKMHEISKHDLEWVKGTYTERYMPKPDDMKKRFIKMHLKDFGKEQVRIMADKMYANLDEIENKVDGEILDKLELVMPKTEGRDSNKLLIKNVKIGLKNRGIYTKKYIDRCKEELKVIINHGFADYFLVVQDYVKWAKDRGILVGPGRGSVCNSEVAFALGITEVDSILFDLDFRRFLRMDKKKIPDIDLDFQTSRRHEVIEYLIKKYEGHAARICAYGLYRVDNTINDLASVCGLPTTGDIDDTEKKVNKATISQIKSYVKNYVDGEELNADGLVADKNYIYYNNLYDDIIKHFIKLYKKVRYIGTHAAGVAITGGDLSQYTAIRIDKDGNYFTNYDLIDIEKVNVIKFDILGLKTMESIGDLRKATGKVVDYSKVVSDPKILDAFNKGECDGIFQFDSVTPRSILQKIDCDCFEDAVAASSMNRPGPLSLKMPDAYAENKLNIEEAKSSRYWEFTKETYGTIVYQEQIMLICVYIGEMEWATADKIIKMMKSTSQKAEEAAEQKRLGQNLLEEFWNGAKKRGFTKSEAEDLFVKMTDSYSFNKGHGVGYTLISFEEMFYKVYYPTEYWFTKIKYASDDKQYDTFSAKAAESGSVIFLPHVNYSQPRTALRKVDDENIIQQGLSDIKGVGEKAAEYILQERKKNGIFTSFDNFYDRCKSRVVTSRVIDILKEQGALEFSKKTYLKRVTKYNSTLFAKASRV